MQYLDATEICHIAFNFEGKAMVQPINYGRNGNKLYIHGSKLNRMTSSIIDAKEICLNVMILDGLKLTRSAFHHSVNYRSVIVFGVVKELLTAEEKLEGLKSIINHFIPTRWNYCRKPNEKELQATRVLEIEITSASAKIANTPPKENKKDLDLNYWAGEIPVKVDYGTPKPDQFMNPEEAVPDHIKNFINK